MPQSVAEFGVVMVIYLDLAIERRAAPGLPLGEAAPMVGGMITTPLLACVGWVLLDAAIVTGAIVHR
jgi:hypothetical protein